MLDLNLNWPAIGATLLPFVGGYYGSRFNNKRVMEDFYYKLERPWFSPPQIAFPIVWSYLYGTMGYASYLVWRDGGGFDGPARVPLMIYGAKMIVNWSFTPVFFGQKKLGLAAIICAALWVGVAITMKSFFEINETAGQLLIPYQIWATLATALSYCIWKNNPDFSKKTD